MSAPSPDGGGGLSPRSTEHVPVVNGSPFVPFVVPWAVRAPRRSLTVVVKATYTLAILSEEGDVPTLVPAVEQRFPEGDVRLDEDDLSSPLVYASDFAPFKPKADVTLVGHGYSEGPDHVAGRVVLAVGSNAASMALFGPRTWDAAGGQSTPKAFDRVPLTHAFAWGGPGDPANPYGLGEQGAALPQLEDPEHLVRSRADRAEPACLAPRSSAWRDRQEHLGTYGSGWLEERWPFFPADFRWSYFNAAHPRLQLSYLRGDEVVTLQGCRPENRALGGRLPGVATRVFAVAKDGQWTEAQTHLDTLHIDADAMEAVVLWRAVVEVAAHDAPELDALVVLDDAIDGPADPEALRRRVGAVAVPDIEAPPSAAPALPIASPRSRAEVERALASGDELAGVDWSGADLTGLSLDGRQLAGAVFTGAQLTEASFRGADLTGARLERVSGKGCDFSEACLREADLTQATLRAARLSKACLEGAVLFRADLDEADLSDVQATGATFAEARLAEAQAERACLDQADLSGANVSRACFRQASLADAVLYDCHADGAVFDRANGGDVRADDGRFDGASFEEASLGGASFEGASLRRARFGECDLDEANFARADLTEAKLDGARLRRSTWRRARADRAILVGADLMQSDLTHASLTDALLTGANLYQCDTWEAELTGAELGDALIAGTKLERRR